MQAGREATQSRLMKVHSIVTLAVLLQCLVPSHAANAPVVLSGRYRCGAEGMRLGLPAGTFTVRYTGAVPNSVAMLRIHNRRTILQQGMAASGSRYVGGRYTWWDAAHPSFTVDDATPQEKTVYCTHAD